MQIKRTAKAASLSYPMLWSPEVQVDLDWMIVFSFIIDTIDYYC